MIGNRIRCLRLERSMTQPDLAQLAGITQSSISGIESGKKNPKIYTLEKIASAFDLTVAELLKN